MTPEDARMLRELEPRQQKEMEKLLQQQAASEKRQDEARESLLRSLRPAARKRAFAFTDDSPTGGDQGIPSGGGAADYFESVEPGVSALRALAAVSCAAGAAMVAAPPGWIEAAAAVYSLFEVREGALLQAVASQLQEEGETRAFVSIDRAARDSGLPAATARNMLERLIGDVIAVKSLG